MCLVNEPENVHFWHGNRLFMTTPCSLTDCVGEERKHGWLQLHSFMSCQHSFMSHQ